MVRVYWRDGKLSVFLIKKNLNKFQRFPRKEDYEEVQVVQLDETCEEKLQRLLETIEICQTHVKEVVDKDTLGLTV